VESFGERPECYGARECECTENNCCPRYQADELRSARRQNAEQLRVCPWRANEPAGASTRTIGRYPPMSITRPRAVLYQEVFADKPAEADPLVFEAEVNTYGTSDRPCGYGHRPIRFRR
jgi:hypothetical protein